MGLEKEWSITFNSEVLGNLLSDFKIVAEEACYPAIHVLFDKFLIELFQKSAEHEYGITDKMWTNSSGSRSYIFVFMGKLIEIKAAEIDIDVQDEDEQIWSVRSFSIETTDKKAFSGFCDLLVKFVSSQNYQEIIRLATEELKKEKVHHLDRRVRFLYKV